MERVSSGCFTLAEVESAGKSFLVPKLLITCTNSNKRLHRSIVWTLMIPFAAKMWNIFSGCPAERRLTK
jgi:hypothetical protein